MPKGYKKDGTLSGISFKKGHRINNGKKHPNRKSPPPFSKETRIKMGIATKSRPNGMLGKKQSEKWKINKSENMQKWHKEIGFSDESKKKIGLAHTGTHPTIETRIKMGISQRKLKRSEEFKAKDRAWQVAHPQKHFKETKIELKVEAELKRLGIIYQKQVPLCKVARVDFYIPAQKIVIQADGCFYHNCPTHCPENYVGRREKDAIKDKILTENGFDVYRFWEHEINKSVENCISRIKLEGIKN